jgi:NADH-quinone oxidoreductase subunit L
VQLTVACIGCFTALLGALIALTQNDLKRVLAYSTISQLGYMFLGLGSGAVTAGVFHLFTHAFFKALLFLSAGSVMHAMGGVIDMRRFSGLRKVMPTTHWTFLAGALALAGLPGLSGFWSKDEIIGGTLASAQGGMPGHYGATVYWVLLVVSIVTAFLTAFYTMRAYSMTFLGAERVPEEAGHHAHESPRSMTIPLMVLAVGAVAAGFLVQPLMELLHLTSFTHFLAEHTAGVGVHEAPSVNWVLLTITSAAAVGGIALGLWVYASRPGVADDAARAAPVLYQASLNKFFFDDLYQRFIVKPLDGLAEFCRDFDLLVIDKIVDIVGMIPRLFGVLFRPVQNGLVQFYALAMILGVVVFLLALVSKL